MKGKVLLFISIFFLILFSTNIFASQIGEFYPSNEIRIESQDYIDAYFDWSFTEINSTHWSANFTINQAFWDDTKICKEVKDTAKDKCYESLCKVYFEAYVVNCKDKEKTDKFRAALENMTEYPLKNLTTKITFSVDKLNISSNIASFYIIFPEGFKIDERASFGFGSTVINTATVAPFYPFQRAICRDGLNYIHVAWQFNSTNLRYANSIDNGATFTLNNSFFGSTSTATSAKYTPSISCNGNNITVAYEDITADDIIVGISADNGATWTWQNPRTSDVYQYVTIERIGQKIYIIYTTATTAYYDVVFFNSSNGGSTWSSNKQLWNGQSFGIYGYIKYYYPALAVNGTGSSTDDLYAAVYEEDYDGTDFTYGMKFKNSADSGKTWSAERIIYPVSGSVVGQPSLTFNNSAVFLTTQVYVGTISTIFYNVTANKGTSWTGRQISMGSNKSFNSVVTLNGTQPFILWENGTAAGWTVNDIFYRNFNGAIWNDYIAYTTDHNGNNYPNAKWDYSGNCMEFVYRNGTASPYNITYDSIGTCTAPITGDTTPPTYSLNSTNSTVAGTPVSHNLYWIDETALDKAITSLWNGSSWINASTWCDLSSNGWCNQTLTVNETAQTLWWKQYANDTSNNWNTSENFSLMTASAGQVYSQNLIDSTTYNEINFKIFNSFKLSNEFINYIDITSKYSFLYKISTDSITYGEILSKSGISAKKLSDSINYNDLILKLQLFQRNPSDSITYSELLMRLGLFNMSVNDYVIYNDIISKLASYNKNLSDHITYAEILTILQTMSRSSSEYVIYQEIINYLNLYNKKLADSITYGELLSKITSFFISRTDSSTYYELLYNIGIFGKSLNDELTYTDLINILKKLFVNNVDSVRYYELLSQLGMFNKNLSETLSYYELIYKIGLFNKGLSDSLTYREMASLLGIYKKSPFDSTTYSELLSRLGIFNKENKDSIIYYDFLLNLGIFNKKLTDSINYFDLVFKLGFLFKNPSDSITYAEILSRIGLFQKNSYDSFNFNDISLRLQNLFRATTDFMTYKELIERITTSPQIFFRTLSDTLSYSQIITRIQTLFKILTNPLNFNDISSQNRNILKEITDFLFYNEGIRKTTEFRIIVIDFFSLLESKIANVISAVLPSLGGGGFPHPILFDVRNVTIIDVENRNIITSLEVINTKIRLPIDIVINHRVINLDKNMIYGDYTETQEMNETTKSIVTNISTSEFLEDGNYEYKVKVWYIQNEDVYAIGIVKFKIEEGKFYIIYPIDYTPYLIVIGIVAIVLVVIYRKRKSKSNKRL